ncbi:MAG: hypothetical protein OCU18_08955 [Candidatus Syntrophoarchaeum sp.]|nr:hypothetical protein [Candidatus Syntrophoarchaeum sp.]
MPRISPRISPQEAVAKLKEAELQHQQDILEPRQYKNFFAAYGVSLQALAKYLNFSYGYVSNLLAGSKPMTPRVKTELDILVEGLEKEAATND